MSDQKSKAIPVLAAFAAVAIFAGAGPAGAATRPAAGPVSHPSPLGISVEEGGWIAYHDTIASSLSLIDPRITVVTGTRDANGGCTFSATEKTARGAAPVFEEEVAYKPATCQEKVMRGGLTNAALAKLSALSKSSPGSRPTTKSSARSSVAREEADQSHHSAFHKSAWIDPVNITITSLAANISWLDNGSTISEGFGSASPYQFQWDNWSNSGTPPATPAVNDSTVSLDMSETFTNTDFERLLSAVLGAAAVAACGFDTSPAVFRHREHVVGMVGGGQSGLSLDTKSGGCSDLVHHMDWGGVGNTN